jgi:hypothetical protein
LEETDNVKMMEFFVYVDENHENLQYPSAESDDNVKIKETLIRQNVKEQMMYLDG